MRKGFYVRGWSVFASLLLVVALSCQSDSRNRDNENIKDNKNITWPVSNQNQEAKRESYQKMAVHTMSYEDATRRQRREAEESRVENNLAAKLGRRLGAERIVPESSVRNQRAENLKRRRELISKTSNQDTFSRLGRLGETPNYQRELMASTGVEKNNAVGLDQKDNPDHVKAVAEMGAMANRYRMNQSADSLSSIKQDSH